MIRRLTIRFLFPLFVLLGAATTSRAQYYSINIDLKTAAAMQAAYSAGAAGEALYNEQLKSILEHYRGAETAAAGIFSSEYLRRRALTDLGGRARRRTGTTAESTTWSRPASCRRSGPLRG